VEALSLSEHTTFVERAMRMIMILLPSQMPRDLPLKASIIMAAQAKVQNPAGRLHHVLPKERVLLQTLMVDEDSDDVPNTLGKVGKGATLLIV